LLRSSEARPLERRPVVISAADPLNLGGILTPGVKTTARAGSRILLLDGVPAARIQGDEIEILGGELLGGERPLDLAEAERHLRSVRRLPLKEAGGSGQAGET